MTELKAPDFNIMIKKLHDRYISASTLPILHYDFSLVVKKSMILSIQSVNMLKGVRFYRKNKLKHSGSS